MTARKWLVIALGFLLLAPLALAQEEPPPDGPPPNAERLQGRMKMLWMWRMVEEVHLTDEVAAKLFPIIEKYEQQIRQVRKEQAEAIRELPEALRKGKILSKKEVLAAYDKTIQTDDAAHDLRRKQLEEVSTILTDEQFHRFLVAQFKFQREMQEMIRDVRGRRGPGFRDGPDGDSPPPPDMQ